MIIHDNWSYLEFPGRERRRIAAYWQIQDAARKIIMGGGGGVGAVSSHVGAVMSRIVTIYSRLNLLEQFATAANGTGLDALSVGPSLQSGA